MNEQTGQVKQGTIIYPEVEALRWTIQQQRDELEKLRAEITKRREAAAALRGAVEQYSDKHCRCCRRGEFESVRDTDLSLSIARYDEMMKGGE